MIKLRETRNLAEVMLWRKEVIEHVFGRRPDVDLVAANMRYYETHLANGSHLALIASVNGEDAGCGSLCLSEELPSPDNPDGRCGYLMNIYVRDPFREKGVGHAIVKRLVAEARERGCEKIYLETTPEGRPLYESLGFVDLPDMMKLCSR